MSRWRSLLVERVVHEWPQAQWTVTSLYSGWIFGFTSAFLSPGPRPRPLSLLTGTHGKHRSYHADFDSVIVRSFGSLIGACSLMGAGSLIGVRYRRHARNRPASANQTASTANGYAIALGHLYARSPKLMKINELQNRLYASAAPTSRRAVNAAPSVRPMRMAPADAARRVVRPRPRQSSNRCVLRRSTIGTILRAFNTTSVEFWRSFSNMSIICRPNRSSSTATSSSQLPNQLVMLALVEPTRAHFPSATAVLAWSITPFHSKMRTPPSSSARKPARLIAPTPNTSTVPGTSNRTSTPSFAAAINAFTYADTPTK